MKNAQVAPQEVEMLRDQVPLLNSTIGSTKNLVIRQLPDVNEGLIQQCCSCIENENKYEIFNGQTKQLILYAHEESELPVRWCCSPMHGTDLIFSLPPDKFGRLGDQVFRARKPFRCFMCFNLGWPCAGTVETFVNNALVGKTSERACTCFTPHLDISSGERGWWGTLKGPSGCIGGICNCMNDDTNYYVFDPNDDKKVLVDVQKDKMTFERLFLDNDVWVVNVHPQTNLKSTNDAAHLVSSIILLDYMFHENNTTNIQQGCFFGYFYFNGCAFPCRLSFNSEGGRRG